MARQPLRQVPADVAVVIPTVLRPSLSRAVRSVFAQDLDGRIQLLIGIDMVRGDPCQLDALRRDCPAHIDLVVVDPGYSTARRNGGVHACGYGGALRTIMSFQANSRYVAYLDDDNWFAPDHLSSLLGAVGGADWAYGWRWMVDPRTLAPICVDDWESVGPERGMFARSLKGFVDTNSLLIDKLACQRVLHLWGQPLFPRGIDGEDRVVFHALRTEFRGKASERATTYYLVGEDDPLAPVRREQFLRHGYDWDAPPAALPLAPLVLPDAATARARLISGLIGAVRRLERDGDLPRAVDLVGQLVELAPAEPRVLGEMARLCAVLGLAGEAQAIQRSVALETIGS